MAGRDTITVSITPELRASIRGQLASGRYGDASEVVRAGLRLPMDGTATRGMRAPLGDASRAAERG